MTRKFLLVNSDNRLHFDAPKREVGDLFDECWRKRSLESALDKLIYWNIEPEPHNLERPEV